MLSKQHPLFFPKLKFVKEDQLVHKDAENSQSGRPIATYKLDWKEQEELIRKKHEKWKRDYHPGKKLPFIGQLPYEWDEWIKSLVFAINDGYMQEIQYWTSEGLLAWNRSNYASADTMIREICLKPAIAMIEVAFALIGDCVYDPEKKWFSRIGKGFLSLPVMLYKFWAYQTGRGLLVERARLDKLGWSLKFSTTAEKNPDDPYIVEGKKLLRDLQKHQDQFEESYKELAIKMSGNEGVGD